MELYLHLHEKSVPKQESVSDTWNKILSDPNYHIIVAEENGKPVSSCTCVIIPNLTRGGAPYALVENVVTHKDFRCKGYASACLDYAREIARKAGCYKIFLMTGSKQESTLRFYEKAGYDKDIKTAFIQML